jgi:hypothetical protein
MYLSDENSTLNKCTCQTRILHYIKVLIRRKYYTILIHLSDKNITINKCTYQTRI